MIEEKYKDLTSKTKLSKNALINLASKILPIFVGIFSIPLLIESLGEARFGLLTLIWLLVGYLSMFDMGIGPAIIHSISTRIGKKEFDTIPEIIWTGIIFNTVLAVIIGLVSLSLSKWISFSVINIDDSLREEVYYCLVYTSLILPFIITTTGFKSVLEALQKFQIVSIIQGVNTLFNYLVPLIIIFFVKNDLVLVVISLLALKIIGLVVYIIFVLKEEAKLKEGILFSYHHLKSMFSYGKWITVTNLMGPFLGQLDRYFITAFLSMTALTFYTTPLEVLIKTMIIPSSLIAVLFPAFSSLKTSSPEDIEKLYLQSLRIIIVALFPTLLGIALLAPYGLNIWLGSDFLNESKVVTQVFCVVFFIRGISYLPVSYLQGINKPEKIAKFYFFEILVFAAGLYLVKDFGNINYVAFISLTVTILDSYLLHRLVYKLINNKKEYSKRVILPLIMCTLIISIPLFLKNSYYHFLVTVPFLIAYIFYEYSFIKNIINKLVLTTKK